MELFVTSFISGYTGAWLVIRYGTAFGLIDTPVARSSHESEVCKGGGVGILFALLVSALALRLDQFIWLPAVIMSIIGFFGGDKQQLSAKKRLIFHFFSCLYFLFFFFASKNIQGSYYLLIVPISIFIVGTTNCYNFMDGIDGIAGITGGVGFGLMAYYAQAISADPGYVRFCIAMAFSCMGFLCLNFPRAKVFLGDVGSILIGFVFACLTIVLSDTLMDFVILTGILLPFYLDEAATMAVRIKDGDSLLSAHRKHVYQLLVNEFNMPHWSVAATYGAAQLTVGVSVFILRPLGLPAILTAYFFYGVLFFFAACVIRRKAALQ